MPNCPGSACRCICLACFGSRREHAAGYRKRARETRGGGNGNESSDCQHGVHRSMVQPEPWPGHLLLAQVGPLWQRGLCICARFSVGRRFLRAGCILEEDRQRTYVVGGCQSALLDDISDDK